MRADPQAATAGERDGDRGVAGAASVQGARRSIPTWRATSRRRECFINHVVTPGRRFATAPLALADVKETGKHLGVTLNDMVLAMAAGALRQLLLRYDGTRRLTADRRRAGQHQPVTGTVGGQRVHLHDPVVAGAHRRSAGAGQADLDGHRDRQGEPPTARADGAARVAVLPPAGARAGTVPQAGQARRVGQRHEPDHLECARTARARPHRGRDRQRDLFGRTGGRRAAG